MTLSQDYIESLEDELRGSDRPLVYYKSVMLEPETRFAIMEGRAQEHLYEEVVVLANQDMRQVIRFHRLMKADRFKVIRYRKQGTLRGKSMPPLFIKGVTSDIVSPSSRSPYIDALSKITKTRCDNVAVCVADASPSLMCAAASACRLRSWDLYHFEYEKFDHRHQVNAWWSYRLETVKYLKGNN